MSMEGESRDTWTSWRDKHRVSTDWTSWTSEYSDEYSSSNYYDDTDSDRSVGSYIILICFSVVCLFLLIFYCYIKIDNCSIPDASNTQVRQQEVPHDNAFECERTVHPPPENRETLSTCSTNDDPWKPPCYDSVAKLDQSFYGEINNPQTTVNKPDPEIATAHDPPPPYPGCKWLKTRIKLR